MMTLNNYQVTTVVLIAVGFILVSPSVFGAVEPHILITMEAGQTTKPLQITDSGGTEIFAVDTSGNIFPSTHHIPVFTLTTTKDAITTVAVGDVEATPVILMQIELFDPDIEDGHDYFVIEGYVQGDTRRDTGSGNCFIGYVYSLNGGNTWLNHVLLTSDNNASFFQERTFLTDPTILVFDATDFAFAVYNSDGATTCSYKDMVTYVEIILTDGATAIQVLP